MIQSLEYETPEDVLYYLLNIAEQFELSRTDLSLHISGLVDLQYKLFRELTNYFRSITVQNFDRTLLQLEITEFPIHYFTPFFNLTSMRIISGEFGGRKINPPANMPYTRPTTDMAKEGLFNILQHRLDLDGINTLDLFGGTGSISYELASRGAANLTILRKMQRCMNLLRRIWRC